MVRYSLVLLAIATTVSQAAVEVKHSPIQPTLVIGSPSTDGRTNSIAFAINNLNTTGIIDKDITF
jgi:hypothetical protein